MTKVITKDKGDTGLIQVMADLDKNQIKIALPVSEHLPFDLIAINEMGVLSRVSVKYRKIDAYGIITAPLRIISSNSQGYKVKYVNFNDIDAYAIFCPDNGKCYYIPSNKFSNVKTQLSLRIDENIKGQTNINKINWAKDYLDPKMIFKLAASNGIAPLPV